MNADTAAGAVAQALNAEKLVMLTDVEGLYRDWPNSHDVIEVLTADELRSMLPTLSSGMIPKMEACLRAVDAGVSRCARDRRARSAQSAGRSLHRSWCGNDGGTHEGRAMTWQQRWPAAMMSNYGAPQVMLTRGKGSRVWDSGGNEYVDLIAGIAVNALGHGDPRITDAITDQLNTLGHVSNLYASEPGLQLAEKLIELTGQASARVFFCNSGAEANEAAFKMTRLTGRTKVVVAEGSFHGRTMGSLALTAQAGKADPFRPLPGDVTVVPFGDARSTRAGSRLIDRRGVPRAHPR